MSIRGRTEGLACTDPGARTSIGVSVTLVDILLLRYLATSCVFRSNHEEDDHGEDHEDEEEGAGVDTDGDDCKASQGPRN